MTERASNLLGNDQTKLAEFRAHISSYRSGAINATELIDAFFSLFDTSSAELGKLIKELADLFEIQTKRDGLLKAWADWKAINEDYPTLPGPSGAGSSSASILGAGIGSNRVLKLKSSTAQSSRMAGQSQRSWNSAAGGPRAEAFPSLSSANGGAKPQPSGWLALRPSAGVTSNAASASSSARPSPTPSRTQSSAQLGKGNSNAFPALPAAKKPTSTVFSPGYTGAGVIRQSNSNTPVNAWGAPMPTSNEVGASTPGPALGEDAETGGKGKGKKGKKQIMFQWG